MSGLTPGVTLRKTFISASSPKATEELDCSPEKSVEWALEVEVVPGQAVEDQQHRGRRGGRRGRRRATANAAQPQGHRLAVVERVVDERVAVVLVVPLADERVGEAVLRLGVEGERELVVVGRPVVVGDLGEVDGHVEAVGCVGQLAHASYAGQGPLATLAAEPPGVVDQATELVVGDGHPSTPETLLWVRRSQRKP